MVQFNGTINAFSLLHITQNSQNIPYLIALLIDTCNSMTSIYTKTLCVTIVQVF